MKPHGNSHENQEEHYLYEIIDKVDNDILKYGISADELLSDGTSPRINNQLKIFNLIAGWMRYFGRIIVTGIQGRKNAEDLEKKYINDYKVKNGRKPIGNK